MELLKKYKMYDFMGQRKISLSISVVLVVASFFLLFTKGLNYGIDFTGGTTVQIKYQSDAPISSIREKLKQNSKFDGTIVSYFGTNDEVVLKIPTSTKNISNDVGDEVSKTIASTGKFEIRKVDMVGPKVGDELQTKGIMAILLSIIVIIIYVSYRFQWRFAISSVVALVHDISIALGAISLFAIDVNLDILAAILTILGYSLNDTIIVFDRIREGITNSKTNKLDEVINDSVSRTLTRTTLTSLTTFFVVFTLYIFGGEIIRGFSFTLLVGIVVGTYSSIFVASTILINLNFSIANYKKILAVKLKQQQEKDRLRAQFEQGTI
ncbi:MAG: protein translocase subunit SecF [Epsilonproteobacteria bacterium]|nr:MAG: protein translocase subunit SecF [Campylobacterota bacterium]